MELKLTRRRFGQMAIAATTTAGLSYLASKSLLAQTSTDNLADIVGVDTGPPATTDLSTGINSVAADATSDATDAEPSSSRSLVVQSLNLGTTGVQSLTPQSVQGGSTPTVEVDDQITGFTYLSDGTLVVALTPVRTSRRGNSPTRLKFLGSSRADLTVSGLKSQEKLGSLLGTRDGKLLGLVMKKNGTPPTRLVEINLQTGDFSDRINLPGNQQLSTLAECPDGRLFATSVDNSGATNLVQVDLGTGRGTTTVSQLRFNNTLWNNGLESLICNSANQLIAFGAPRYVGVNALYTIDASNGNMTKLRDFDVAKVTIRPS